MNRLLLGAAVAAAAAIGLGQTANATPYAFASQTFNNFLITLSGATANGGSVQVYTSQSYPGGTNGGPVTTTYTGSNNSTTGPATSYSFGGPNAPTTGPGDVTSSTPSPITTTSFAPSLNGGMGDYGAAAVGASSVYTGSGDGAYAAAASGGAPVPPGTIASTATQTENVYTIAAASTCPANGCTVNFSFNVQSYSFGSTTRAGETATANTGGSIAEYLCGNTSCTSSSQVGPTFSPTAVASSVSQTAGPGSQSSGTYTFSSISQTFDLAAGGTYEFILQADANSQTKSVPEPGSLAILGTAILGLTAFVRRRRSR